MKKYITIFLLTIAACSWNDSNAATNKLPSLCDEWNILGRYKELFCAYDFRTFTHRLTTDTVINSYTYIQIEEEGVFEWSYRQYLGALREDDNANIYYIPAESTHEYLLYAFNAHVGDTLTNVWIGGTPGWSPNGHKVIIKEISETHPRIFILDAYKNELDNENSPWEYSWIEGVGFPQRPDGISCPFDCVGGGVETVLCAYENGEQIYTSEDGQEYGCEYNAKHVNISLYQAPDLAVWDSVTGIEPSSRDTLVPVSKQDITAVLSGHNLYFNGQLGWSKEIQLIALDDYHVASSVIMESGGIASFHLTTPGSYMIVVNPLGEEGVILGRVDFEVSEPESVEPVVPDGEPSSATKILRNGQIYILRGDKTYSIQGAEIK